MHLESKRSSQAQSLERSPSGQECVGSISDPGARFLLVGSVSG